MVTKECKLVQKVVTIVRVVKKGTKFWVIDQVHLGIDQIGTKQSRKSHASSSLSPGGEVVEPSTHDGSWNVALRRGKVDAEHASMFDTVGEVFQKMLASAIGWKTWETIVKGSDHLGTEDDRLEMAHEVDFIQMGKMKRNSMVANPAILRAHGEPRNNRTRGEIHSNRGGLFNAKLIPLLIRCCRRNTRSKSSLSMGSRVVRLVGCLLYTSDAADE